MVQKTIPKATYSPQQGIEDSLVHLGRLWIKENLATNENRLQVLDLVYRYYLETGLWVSVGELHAAFMNRNPPKGLAAYFQSLNRRLEISYQNLWKNVKALENAGLVSTDKGTTDKGKITHVSLTDTGYHTIISLYEDAKNKR